MQCAQPMPNPVNQSAEQQTVCTNVTHLTATNGMAEIAGVDTTGVDKNGGNEPGGQCRSGQ